MEKIMKKTIIIALMLSTSGICMGSQGWPKSTISKEQAELNALRVQVAIILEQFAGSGHTLAGSSDIVDLGHMHIPRRLNNIKAICTLGWVFLGCLFDEFKKFCYKCFFCSNKKSNKESIKNDNFF